MKKGVSKTLVQSTHTHTHTFCECSYTSYFEAKCQLDNGSIIQLCHIFKYVYKYIVKGKCELNYKVNTCSNTKDVALNLNK